MKSTHLVSLRLDKKKILNYVQSSEAEIESDTEKKKVMSEKSDKRRDTVKSSLDDSAQIRNRDWCRGRGRWGQLGGFIS